MEYLGLLADDGCGGFRCVARYDDSMPGWQFQQYDRFHVADFDGNGQGRPVRRQRHRLGHTPTSGCCGRTGRLHGGAALRLDDAGVADAAGRPALRRRLRRRGQEDLGVFNGSDWSYPYLGLLRSDGTSLVDGTALRCDVAEVAVAAARPVHVGDFDGDGHCPTSTSSTARTGRRLSLRMFKSLGDWLYLANRYDGTVPGWQMRRHDRHWVGGHRRRAGRPLRLQPRGLGAGVPWAPCAPPASGSRRRGARTGVGEWNLGSVDRFEVGDVEGAAATAPSSCTTRTGSASSARRRHCTCSRSTTVDPQLPPRLELVGGVMASTPKNTPRAAGAAAAARPDGGRPRGCRRQTKPRSARPCHRAGSSAGW